MTDVYKPHFAGFHAPIDQIGIAAGREHSCGLFSDWPASFGKFADQFDGPLNGAFDVARAARAVPIDIFQN
jgi:hypothetical protein